ncbi:putative Ig domain-containing protein [Pelagicoccus sp. SDUM812003]|uniref:putative Ig domain-containing protein n=1 Tax=Pelagicoccus sp. SDUM812003 TaxID=3041267 RepID=UPI00280F96A5|nr:putative Ig domain-containing protein [Pelagicoccus sp. SDUM812003]MDQ8205091.1 putative Ig domain-containing protein [Pelagicoccus sp. SDUM812003]
MNKYAPSLFKLASWRANTALIALITLLQKSPVIQALTKLDRSVLAPLARITQKATVAIAGLGSYQAISGATTAVYVTNPEAPVSANRGEPFSLTFSVQNTMARASSWSVSGVVPEGLAVSGSQGEPMIDGTYFNAEFGLISGTPTVAGAFTIFLKPWRDAEMSGPTAEAYELVITINSDNNSPILDAPIEDQSATTGQSFSLDISASFSDPDPNDELSYSAEQTDGSDLPDWLSITPSTGVLSGTPSANDVGAVLIRVTASDGELSAEDEFSLSVTEPIDLVATDLVLERIGNTLLAKWSIVDGLFYTLEMTSNPIDPQSWAPLETDVITENDQQRAELELGSLPDSIFLRVSTSDTD